jgi:hypothetical protein
MADRPNRSPPGVPPPPFRGEHHTHDARSEPQTQVFCGNSLLCFSPSSSDCRRSADIEFVPLFSAARRRVGSRHVGPRDWPWAGRDQPQPESLRPVWPAPALAFGFPAGAVRLSP